jgi:isoquinoline 1-oxidoreductase beta subunit
MKLDQYIVDTLYKKEVQAHLNPERNVTVISNVSRRSFLKGLGVTSGSLVIGGSLAGCSQEQTSETAVVADAPLTTSELNVFVSVSSDNSVSIICARSEMGQGVRTSLPQIVADELEADWALVKVVQGIGDNAYGNQNTDGSTSVRGKAFTILRQMGASAKVMLEQAAAQVWQVPVAECKAENHQVAHTSGKSLSYGELASVAAGMTAPAPESLKLKDKSQFKYIGKGITSVDLPDVVNGTTEFGQDVQVPDMLIASIERCPVIGGSVKSFDATKAKQVKGVVDVIQIDNQPLPVMFHPLAGVAVIATNTYAANKGRAALEIEWELGPNAEHNSDTYLQERIELVKQPGTSHRKLGDVAKSLTDNTKQVEAVYTVPYHCHASMEPPAATTRINADGTVDVWACTQTPQRARDLVAAELGMSDASKVTVNVTLLGGAFGRKGKPDFVVESARLAKAVGKPVKVVWTREDDIKMGYFHSISAQYYNAAFDDNGKVDGLLARTSFPSIGSTFNPAADEPLTFETGLGFVDMPFEVPNISLEAAKAPAHLRMGWVRSVSNIHHGFAVGSFVDELAHAAQADPRQFWLDLVGSDRMVDLSLQETEYGNYSEDISQYPIDTKRFKNVVNEVCDLAGWGKELPEGEGLGLAVHRSFVSYVGAVAHVKVEDNKVTVKKMYAAGDFGSIVNIDRVEAQLEGALIFGLNIALYSKMSVKDGVIEQSNFHDYELARMNQAPELVVKSIPSDAVPGGVGEPGLPPVMASITNAIFAASGKRIRDLPVKGQMDV